MKRLLTRNTYLDRLIQISDPGLVRIITGVRRCGKSALLALYREHLMNKGVEEEEILVINFEDSSLDSLREPQAFHAHVVSAKKQGVRYLHIDEVQELGDWARIVNSLRLHEDLEICVTGSNASMFVGESMTYLAGRYLEIRMLPLSLGEFQKFTTPGNPNTPDELGSPAEALPLWMRIGGFPASALAYATSNDETLSLELNRSLFDSIFTRDIATRGQIRDLEVFLRTARFIFDNSGSPVSVRRIRGQLKNAGIASSSETINRYLGLMEDAHLIYRCDARETQGHEWLKTNGKYYFVDPGLRNALLGSRDINLGHDLENMVFLELLRRGYHVSSGHAPKGKIDFIATRGTNVAYIQVALNTADPATLKRELAPFDFTPSGARCYLITLDRFSPGTGQVTWVDGLEFLAGQANLQ